MAALFKPDMLKDLYEVEEGFVESLAEDYQKTAFPLVEAIEKSTQMSDFKQLEHSAHALRSSSKLLGMEQLSELCLKIELSAIDGKLEPQSVTALRKTQVDSYAELKNHLSIKRH